MPRRAPRIRPSTSTTSSSHGTIVCSSYEFTGYDAHLTIRHPNGHTYTVRAWNDSEFSDAEAIAGDVGFDDLTDQKEFPESLIREMAYTEDMRRKGESALGRAARLVIASWETGNLADAVKQLSDALREKP